MLTSSASAARGRSPPKSFARWDPSSSSLWSSWTAACTIRCQRSLASWSIRPRLSSAISRTVGPMNRGAAPSDETEFRVRLQSINLEPPMSALGQKQTSELSRGMSALCGGFNRSTQHLLILLEKEVCDGGDCTDMVHVRAELWERWKNGQCVADIARALARRNKSGVYRILALNGGIAPE